jgi:NADH-ubiquinone oxidoreductase chain 6
MLIGFLIRITPYTTRLILLIICFCLIRSINLYLRWIRYILCLIYLGGILVILIYISSLLPNFSFNLSFYRKSFNKILIILLLVLISYFLKINILNSFSNFIFNYFNFGSRFSCLIILLSIILLILIISSDFCKLIKSPLRII